MQTPILNLWLILFPVIGALTGALVQFIALRVFLDRVLPRKKEALGRQLGQVLASGFTPFDVLEEKLNDPRNLQSVLPVVETHIDHFLNEKLKTEMPMVSMFIGNKTTDKLKEVFMREIELILPKVIGHFASGLREQVQLDMLVAEKIGAIPDERLRDLVSRGTKGSRKTILLLGALTGCVTGLLLLLLTILTA